MVSGLVSGMFPHTLPHSSTLPHTPLTRQQVVSGLVSGIFRKVLVASGGADVDEDPLDWEDLRRETIEAASAKSAAAQEVRACVRGRGERRPLGCYT